MFIDEQGLYGGGSDHNWIFLELNDNFVKKCRISNLPRKKAPWNISHSQDWSAFRETIDKLVDETDTNLDAAALASRVAEILLKSGTENMGFKSASNKKSMLATTLPRDLVTELELKRQFERTWKTKSSLFSSTPIIQRTEDMQESLLNAERVFQNQKVKVDQAFTLLRSSNRKNILKKCSGKSAESSRFFWSHLNQKICNPVT